MVSPRLAAYADWIFPRQHVSWGGPMNGQAGRCDMIRKLACEFDFDAVIETGTFRGQTAAFLADAVGADVHSVEASARYWWFSHWRLGGRSSVHVEHGDSRTFLRNLDVPNSATVLIYLDAHWEDDLPLADELRIISDRWSSAVVMVDDFEVPGDAGYAFDDYGPGKALRADLLPDEVAMWTLLYPTLPSSEETGSRRGCALLASPSVDPTRLARCGCTIA